jgi:hypothetical protein
VPEFQTSYGEKSPLRDTECPYFRAFKETLSDVEKAYLYEHADSKIVKANNKNVKTSFDKCDVSPVEPNDEIEAHVDKLMDEYLGPIMKVGVSRDCEFTQATSPGKTWKKKYGCKTKGEVLNHPEFAKQVFDIDHIPLWSVSPKVEILPEDEIVKENKIRTFFIPDMELLAKEKILYDKQNEAIVKHCEKTWIKYGYTKQYNGFNALGKSFEGYGFVNEGDCRGFDRHSYLKKVYEFRNKHLICPDELVPMREYTTQHTVRPLVICPDGVLRFRPTGNCSGSNNTCADNSILHVRVIFRWICKVHLRDFGCLPSLKICLSKNNSAIYSDDQLTTFQKKYYSSTNLEILMDKVSSYKDNGFELKPKQEYSSESYDRIDKNHSFLGSSFLYDDISQSYIPFPRLGKLCSSLLYIPEEKPVECVFAKSIMIAILACPCKELFQICQKFMHFMAAIIKEKNLVIPESYRQMLETVESESRCFLNLVLGRQGRWSKIRELIKQQRMEGRMDLKEPMKKVARKEKILKALGDRMGVSDEDIAWFTKSLDPFHDVPVQHLQGYPDGANTNTIVQTVKQSFTIERNGNLATSKTWGFMLRMDDHQLKEDCVQAELIAQNVTLGTPFGVDYPQYGGITEVQFTSTTNDPLYAGLPNTAGSTNVIVNNVATSTDPSYVKGRSRVIARGFEIHNTTAEIEKQGTITSFQMPSTLESESVYNFVSGVSVAQNKEKLKFKELQKVGLPGNFKAIGQKTARLVQLPPDSVGNAVILPGSLQWEAKDGAMMVQKMNTTDNDFTYRDFSSVILLPDESEFPPTTVTDSLIIYTPRPDLTTDSSVPYEIIESSSWAHTGDALNDSAELLFETNKRIPYQTIGLIASGLGDNSTFTVNWIEVIERCPTWSEKDLIVLATPSPKRCDSILRLYSLVANELPVAVPVSENGFGDWFCGVVDSVVNTLSTIGKPLMGAVRGYQEEREKQRTVIQPAQTGTYLQSPVSQTQRMMKQTMPPLPRVPVRNPPRPKKKTIQKKNQTIQKLNTENQVLAAALKGSKPNKSALLRALK